MSPAELADLLSCPGAAADMMEAIDDPGLGRGRGWDLSGWRHDPVPWGVRFSYRGPGRPAEVLALVALDGRLAHAYRGPHSRGHGARVLLLG
jgi:hypothetical protein